MKKTILLVIIVALAKMSFAQVEGVIEYQEIINLELNIDGIPEAMKAMIPKSQSFDKELLFSANKSLYRDKTGTELEDMNMESENGSIMIKFSQDDTEELLYISREDNQLVHQKGIMGRSFIVESEIEKFSWKLTNEKIKYLGYECQKAVIEDEEKFIVAWFTTKLPLQIGPGPYSGLPGPILLLSIDEGSYEIRATKVDLRPLKENEIKIPTDGKKVTAEEYDKINEEKQKEMQQMYGGGKIMKVGK